MCCERVRVPAYLLRVFSNDSSSPNTGLPFQACACACKEDWLVTEEHQLTVGMSCSVSVRIRPLNEAEAEKGSAWKLEANTIVPVHARGGEGAESCYNLDNVFDASWTTEQVYLHTTGDIITKVVGGFNGARALPSPSLRLLSLHVLTAQTTCCRHRICVWPNKQWQDAHDARHARGARHHASGRPGHF